MNQQLTDDNSTEAAPAVGSVGVLAAYLGLTEMRIQQLAQDKIIEKLSHGHYDLQQCVSRYCEYIRGVSRGSDSAKAEQIERTRLTRVRADMGELEHAEKVGALIQADVVQRQGFTLAVILKNNLLSIPDRLSAIVAAETDPAEVHDLISAEVRNSLDAVIKSMESTEVDDATLDITRHNAAEIIARTQATPDTDEDAD